MQSLKYGQVIIATPSRYPVLSNSGENGEELEQGEIEQKEEDEKVEDEMDNISHEEEEQMEMEGGYTRQYLPRKSKYNHRAVSVDTLILTKEKNLGSLKKGARKKH